MSGGTAGCADPAARGAPEETRMARRRDRDAGRGFAAAVTSKSALRSAGVLGYVTDILS